MAMIAMLSAKTSPGVTTTVAALTTAWPTPVLAVGADPGGDDLMTGWLGEWLVGGWIRPERGLLGFITASRHADQVGANDLRPYVQAVPGTTHARILTGLAEPSQAASIGPSGWQRLANALEHLSKTHPATVDVIVDCGRFGTATPWPLLRAADIVLIAVRSERRSVLAARPLVRLLSANIPIDRLGLSVTAASYLGGAQAAEVLRLPIGLRMPVDPQCAEMFSDGSTATRRRSALWRAADGEAKRLHHSLNHSPVVPPVLVGARP
nr:hypothetical protein [Kibdelosporangium sp. MJ126-NF4]CEL17634.1 hypothetical protein [Kibdelosporangium sp. MJ126-NF4]CTQ91138.1 hypothetical protein [Kibdelosporangium sp. MJ126-NF4]